MRQIRFLLLLLCPLISAGQLFGQWVQIDSGLAYNVNAYTVIGPNLFAGTEAGTFGGVFLSTDNGTSWTQVDSDLINTPVYTFAVLDSNIFVGTYSGVFLSTDKGESWAATGMKVGAFRIAVLGTNLFTIGSGLFLSTDDGKTWINTGYQGSVPPCTCMASNDTNLFIGYSSGVGVLSYDGSALAWVNSGFFPNWQRGVTSVLANGANVFAGTAGLAGENGGLGGVNLSTNSGKTWTQLSSISTPYSFAVSGTNLFAATTSGVYLSTDTGKTWTTTGLVYETSTLLISDSCLFAGGPWGAWRRPLHEMITSVHQSITPEGFGLAQNYPNPFNPSTVINYQLPSNNVVSMKVFDALGREVETLVNERQSAGFHSVRFNAFNLPSGVYFYRVEAGSHVATKKLLLLK